MTVCEVCQTGEFAEIEVARQYTGGQPIHVCTNCGMVQVVNRRPPEEIFADWEGQSPGDTVYLSAHAAVRARHAYVAEFMDLPEMTTLLDIGAGTGDFAELLRKEKNVLAHSHFGMAEDMHEGEFAAATIMWTLENCGSARNVINAARKATADNGILIVATGSRILVPFKKPLDCYLGPAPLDLHPWRFSAATLKYLLRSCGYSIIKTNKYIDNDYLVVVARKTSRQEKSAGDDYREVIAFFERWHKESQHYRNQ